MGTILEDLEDHEGYADRRLPDGRLAGGVWSRDTLDWTGYVAACGCGWHGTVDWSPTDAGEEFAVDQWRWAHAEPLLQQQAERRRGELTRVLGWLGTQADQFEDPAGLERISRAVDHARQLVDHLQRDRERQAPEREADHER
jgi:hypothetical protein